MSNPSVGPLLIAIVTVPIAFAGGDVPPFTIVEPYDLTFLGGTWEDLDDQGTGLGGKDGTLTLGGPVIESEEVPDGLHVVQALIHDEAWPDAAVHGKIFLCRDDNADHVCGDVEDTRILVPFCGRSPEVALAEDWTLVSVAVGSALHQFVDCLADKAPTGAVRGEIVVTFS